jgi:fructan beta-fructosidase
MASCAVTCSCNKKSKTKKGAIPTTSFEGRKDLGLTGQQFEVVFELDLSSSLDAGIVVGKGPVNETMIGYDKQKKTLYIDRSKSGEISFTKNFGKRYEAPLSLTDNRIKLRVFFDNSIIEVFANDGEMVMTAQIFPLPTDNKVQLYSNGGKSKVNSLEYWAMASIWK